MVKVKKDLTGQKFGRLTVIRQAEDYVNPNTGKHSAKWECRCECGNIIVTSDRALKSGATKSCGCLSREVAQKQAIKNFKKYNPFEICGDYVTMYTLKNEPFYVDLEDFERVKDTCWWRREDGYILGRISGATVRLHRFVMNCPDGYDVDHIRGKNSRNDNRKSNLRIATRSQNNMNKGLQSNNTSGVTGVYWDNTYQKWKSQIRINNKNIGLGMFNDKESAINARKKAEEKYFGEWSYDNSQNIINNFKECDV